MTNNNSSLVTATKVFMIIGCIANAFFIIPLIWAIPMTISYFNAKNNDKTIGTGFKVCTLLFVSQIAGILMLCDSSND